MGWVWAARDWRRLSRLVWLVVCHSGRRLMQVEVYGLELRMMMMMTVDNGPSATTRRLEEAGYTLRQEVSGRPAIVPVL